MIFGHELKTKKTKSLKALSLATALLFASALLSSPLSYADGNRKEFEKGISKETKSANYDKLTGDKGPAVGATGNLKSGEASVSTSVVEGSKSGSTESGIASGSASGSVASAKAEGNYSADLTHTGVKASAGGSASATLVEGSASGKAGGNVGGADVELSGSASGMAGAKAEANASGELSGRGVGLEGKGEAFAGAKVEGDTCGSFSCFGIKVTAKVEGDLRAGAGAEAHGVVNIGKKMQFGGKLAGAVGVGGGLGGSIEIDVSELIDDIWNWFDSPKTPQATPAPQDTITSTFQNFDVIKSGPSAFLSSGGGVTPTAALDGGPQSQDLMGGAGNSTPKSDSSPLCPEDH